ncbi:rRNA processing/ribosome biogenesis-domain-containing protein [Microdochium trichocladiopsis]|uniref:Pre-rRNA-processing protein RIX1 n=1 Tax=Microdochium trichocladiopsis TaxID=1682393 RepID=A0A9P9BYE4_9PEZI|nr:rRNA processing/ribosome biogenesis-domain-containing protein [Microdochium trichocladiopsis]KAH7037978.1 rRNA processing/ribosome biogenesis-domain-containing protein [Microdochium trichocladiopsis]
MAHIALPAELRSLCRRLASSKPEALLGVLPALLEDVLRCEVPLSKPQEAKGLDSTPEASALVHKLKTQITTLLQGRSAAGRFLGVALAKAAVEAGGWECLRSSEPWVRALLSILQKKDPAVTKEAALVTLVKIYTLLHEFPTLIREIVTPTLPTLATSCLQILKPPPSTKAQAAPFGLTETIFETFSTLVPLYPTTLRQFAAKLRQDARAFVAPTCSDEAFVPRSLVTASRRLTVRLHMTAAKGGDAAEWNKQVSQLVRDAHSTADQVFRAIVETWESSSGYVPQRPDFEQEPSGGSDKPDDLPTWSGIQAGSERLVGLLGYLAEVLRSHTKSAVTIPISSIMDITTRISSIVPPSANKERFESAQMNAAVGREERDELWSALPGIQIAVMTLLSTLINRLGRSFVPLAQESLEQTLRMLGSFYRIPEVRHATYILARKLLGLCGPTMAKISVDGLDLVIKCCCRDLHGASGHLRRTQQHTTTLQNGNKTKSAHQNADAFLSPAGKAAESTVSVSLSTAHIRAAEALLATLHSSVPQQHVQSAARGRMLQAAILARSKEAQVASVLHPLRDSSGRSQVILPYLMRQFPHDAGVELLRFNFRPMATGRPGGEFGDFGDANDDDADVDMTGDESGKPATAFGHSRPQSTYMPSSNPEAVDEQPMFGVGLSDPSRSAAAATAAALATTESPFLAQTAATTTTTTSTAVSESSTTTSALKRKNDADETSPPKRVEVETTVIASSVVEAVPQRPASRARVEAPAPAEGDDDDDSDDESVHLNMELDSEGSDDDGEE